MARLFVLILSFIYSRFSSHTINLFLREKKWRNILKNNRETKLFFFQWPAKTKWRRKTKTTFLFATLRLILIGEWQSSIFFGCWKTKNYYSNVCIFRETTKITRITRTRLRDQQHTEKKRKLHFKHNNNWGHWNEVHVRALRSRHLT